MYYKSIATQAIWYAPPGGKFIFFMINLLFIKLSFHVIAHDCRIAENTASDRQRLYGNTFQRSGDRERSYSSLIPVIRQS